MKSLPAVFTVVALSANPAQAQHPEEKLPKLKVSGNGWFLVTEVGKIFVAFSLWLRYHTLPYFNRRRFNRWSR